MKSINTLVLATTMMATGSAFAMSGDPVTEYLRNSHLIGPETAAAMVVERAPATNLDPATEYLVKSGLLDAPTVTVSGQQAAASPISPELNYWEAPAS